MAEFSRRHHHTDRGLTNIKNTGDYPISLGFEDTERFLSWIDGTTTLDLGSGYGMLAKEVELQKLRGRISPETKILSLNPEAKNKRFQKIHKKGNVTDVKMEIEFKGTRSALGLKGRRLPRHLNETHDKNAIARSWDDTGLEPNSIDKVAANYSFPMYCESYEEMKAVIKEMWRILKPGGEWRISPPKENSIKQFEGLIVPPWEAKKHFFNTLISNLELAGFDVTEVPVNDPKYLKEIAKLPENERKEHLPISLSVKKPIK